MGLLDEQREKQESAYFSFANGTDNTSSGLVDNAQVSTFSKEYCKNYEVVEKKVPKRF